MARWEPSMCLIYCSTCGDLLPTWSVCCLCKLVSHAGSRQSHDSVLLEKWSDMKWHPSMVTHTQNVALHLTHPSAHTLWTHTRSSGQPMLRRPETSWEFGALLKGLTSVVVLEVGRALVIYSTDNSCRRWDSLQVHTLGRDFPAPHTVNTHPACDAQTQDLQIRF